jgi:hypothetical protein
MKFLKHLLIPHKGNDHKPHLLRNEAVVVVVAFVLLAEILYLAAPMVVFRYTNFFAEVLPNVLVDATNKNRSENKVPALTANELLQKAAQLKANDMATKGYFAHTSPEGVTPWHWLDVAGYTYKYAGENLAVNFYDSQDVENAWMNSPTHRANLLNDRFTEIGIATARGLYQGREAVFVAQFFGRPAIAVVPSTPTAPVAVAEKPASLEQTTKEISKVLAANISAPVELIVNAPETFATAKNVKFDESIPTVLPNIDGQIDTRTPQYSTSFQSFASKPRTVTNYFYVVLFTIILAAIALKLFVKMDPEHHGLIVNGVMMLILIAIALLVNQYSALASAGIF